MNKLTVEQFQAMVANALDCLKERAAEFSQLDAVLGDGDHGEAIVTAFTAAEKASKKDADFKTLLSDMGFAVMLETSGSTSTLLGGFLLGMSDGVPAGAGELDTDQIKAMFREGLAGVAKNTNAARGDKTMMDALIPAVEAIEACDSKDTKTIMEAGAMAAREGAEATVGMKANFGRARNLGDKTIGHADSGATSWSCMFDSFAKAL